LKKVIFIHLLNNYTGSPKVLRDVILNVVNSGEFNCMLLTSKTDGFLSQIDSNKISKYSLLYKWHDVTIFSLLYFLLAQFQIFFFILFKTNKNDIIYLNTILPFSAYLASRVSHRKIVNHIHEDMNLNKPLYKLIKKVYKRYNQDSIFVSKYLESVTCNVKKSFVVYNTIFNSYKHTDIDLTKKKNILMISSLKKFKGVDTFINLAKSSEKLSFQLVLSSTHDEIESFLKSNNFKITDNLKIFSIQKDLSTFYQEALITLVLTKPSQWIETFGLTILESFSYGTPVIAPNFGGPKELINNSENGYLLNDVENISSIKQLIKDFVYRRDDLIKMSFNSLDYYKKFIDDNSYDKITKYLSRK
jgi:L-malate glycosyltransferase